MPHDAGEDFVARQVAEQNMKRARRTDRLAQAAGHAVRGFLLDVLAQRRQHLARRPSRDHPCDLALDGFAGLENGARLGDVGRGDEGAAVGMQRDQPVVRQADQHLADLAPADIEDFAQSQFVELGAGRQPLIDDRRENMVVNVVQAIGLGPVKGVAQADKFRAFETIDGRFPGHHAGILSDGLRAIKTIY